MNSIGLLVGFLFVAPLLVQGESNYWDHIQQLVKEYDTPQGNPQLETYLKGLAPGQMLQAAREYSQYAEKKFPVENWAEAVMDIGLTLAFYGTEQNRLTDDRLNALFMCITDENESQFFRESLVLLLRQRYWDQLTDNQRKRGRHCFLSVLLDKKAPERLRVISCQELSQAMAENHRRIIISDMNVRSLRNDKQKWRQVDELVRKGDVRLEAETYKALETLQVEFENISLRITELSEDIAESLQIKEAAKSALKIFSDMPVSPEQ
ncbi:MAG: hypothetical protein WCS62_05110 [Bacilli bacterium]